MALVEGIQQFFDKLRQLDGRQRLSLRVNPDLQTIDWLAADDLTKGLDALAEQDDRRRAIETLTALPEVLGIEGADIPVYKRRLKLHSVTQSSMGSHYSVILCERGQMYPNHFFRVHCSGRKVFMINSVYQPAGLADETAIAEVIEPEDVPSIPGGTPQMRVGRVYGRFWTENAPAGMIVNSTTPVVLRDLYEMRGVLSGRYVIVHDHIDNDWRQDPNKLCFAPSHLSDSGFTSHCDRVAAYYHTDLIQRYFRSLGLPVDEYPIVRRIQVDLTGHSIRSHYDPEARCAYFAAIPNEMGFRWTDARDARWIYHEYVHALTHALAQFRRPTMAELIGGSRAIQMIQACAMDEGFADYFACSLAEQQGATVPEFGQLAWNGNVPTWKALRRLTGEPIHIGLSALPTAPQHIREEWETWPPGQPDRLYYKWGECWGRFLWRLRHPDVCGVEVADTLIAHSLCFFTRWSDFAAGVWALVMADERLFGGIHRRSILQASEVVEIQVLEDSQLGDLMGNDILNISWNTSHGAMEQIQAMDIGETWIADMTQLIREPTRIALEKAD